METMHFHIAHTNFFRKTSFRIQVVPENNLAPMKNCPGVLGNLNWMPGHNVCNDKTQPMTFLCINISLGLNSRDSCTKKFRDEFRFSGGNVTGLGI